MRSELNSVVVELCLRASKLNELERSRAGSFVLWNLYACLMAKGLIFFMATAFLVQYKSSKLPQ